MVIPPEEFWIRSGAKPKVIGRIRGSLSPQAMSKEQGTPYFMDVFVLRNIQKDIIWNTVKLLFW